VSLIDQRILVVAPADVVWSYLTAPSTMQKWNRLAKQLSILSTHATGVGARRRCTDERGRMTIEEITAWVDNIGYEYTMIDGAYRSLKGRIRLQAVAEGTIVNWTVDYHLKGILIGVRNVLFFRRGYQRMMADSLRELRKVVEKSGVKLDPERQARFAMQADPGIEARAARITPEGKPLPRAERVVLPPTERVPARSVVIDDDTDLDALPTVLPSVLPTVAAPATRPPAALPPAEAAPAAPSPAPAILHAFTPPTPAAVPAPSPQPASQSASMTASMMPGQPAFVSRLEAELERPGSPAPIIHEPPIAEDDTRQRTALRNAAFLPGHQPAAPTARPVPTAQPVQPVQIDEPPITLEDTPPSGTGRLQAIPVMVVDNGAPAALTPETPPARAVGVEASADAGADPDADPDADANLAAAQALTVPIALVAPPTPPPAPSPVTQTMEVVVPPAPHKPYIPPQVVPPPPESLPERVPTLPMIVVEPFRPPPTNTTDTGEMSIWDVFGVESPTQKGIAALNEVVAQVRATSEMAAFSLPGEPAAPAAPPGADEADEADDDLDGPTVILSPIKPGAALAPPNPQPPQPLHVGRIGLSRRAHLHVRAWSGRARRKVQPRARAH
jgi:hypothetical protein